MLVVDPEQSEPLQHRAGRLGAVRWHVSPGAQAPLESQRHPFEPATQVDVTPVAVPLAVPLLPPVLEPPEPPPHTLGTPPHPQHCGALHVPHGTKLPHPSRTGPQFFPSAAHAPAPHTLVLPPPRPAPPADPVPATEPQPRRTAVIDNQTTCEFEDMWTRCPEAGSTSPKSVSPIAFVSRCGDFDGVDAKDSARSGTNRRRIMGSPIRHNHLSGPAPHRLDSGEDPDGMSWLP